MLPDFREIKKNLGPIVVFWVALVCGALSSAAGSTLRLPFELVGKPTFECAKNTLLSEFFSTRQGKHCSSLFYQIFVFLLHSLAAVAASMTCSLVYNT